MDTLQLPTVLIERDTESSDPSWNEAGMHKHDDITRSMGLATFPTLWVKEDYPFSREKGGELSHGGGESRVIGEWGFVGVLATWFLWKHGGEAAFHL